VHGHLLVVVCPRCGQNAPIVYKGIAAYCTACGAARIPLTEKSVNLAGQPAQIGGTLARIVGWLVLGGGLFLALLLGAILQAIFPVSVAGFVVGGGIAIGTIALAMVILRGGKSLREGGVSEEKSARTQAIFAMAPMRGGIVRPYDVAMALQISLEAADAILTDLAKTKPEHVSLEIDDQGGVYYRIDSSGRGRVRVDAFDARVRASQARVAMPGEPLEEPEEEQARARRAAR